MTCELHTLFSLAVAGAVLVSGCAKTTEVTLVGTVRTASQGCVAAERGYVVEVPSVGGVPASVPGEWCGVLPDTDGEIICFLYSENGYGRPGLDAAQRLEHIDVAEDHPGLDCWQAELAAWDETWEPSDPAAYHPLWNHDALR